MVQTVQLRNAQILLQGIILIITIANLMMLSRGQYSSLTLGLINIFIYLIGHIFKNKPSLNFEYLNNLMKNFPTLLSDRWNSLKNTKSSKLFNGLSIVEILGVFIVLIIITNVDHTIPSIKSIWSILFIMITLNYILNFATKLSDFFKNLIPFIYLPFFILMFSIFALVIIILFLIICFKMIFTFLKEDIKRFVIAIVSAVSVSFILYGLRSRNFPWYYSIPISLLITAIFAIGLMYKNMPIDKLKLGLFWFFFFSLLSTWMNYEGIKKLFQTRYLLAQLYFIFFNLFIISQLFLLIIYLISKLQDPIQTNKLYMNALKPIISFFIIIPLIISIIGYPIQFIATGDTSDIAFSSYVIVPIVITTILTFLYHKIYF